MSSGKQDQGYDKLFQANIYLQTNEEFDIQDTENLESTKGKDESLELTLKVAGIKTKQTKTDLEHNKNESIKDGSTVQPSMTYSPTANGNKINGGETDCVSEVGELETSERKFVETSEDKSGRLSRFLQRSYQELSKSLLLEELEKATARLGFLERYNENVQQEITKIKTIGSIRREQIRQEFASFYDLLQKKEKTMLEELDKEIDERVTHVTNTLQASVVSLEKESASLTTTVTDLAQSLDDTRFTEEFARAKDLFQQMDVKVKEFHRNWARNSMYTPSPVLDNYFTMREEKRDLSDKLDEAMALPKLRFKQKTLSTYPRSPIRLSEYIECSGAPPSTDVLYTIQLFHRSILVYEQISKQIQDMRLNDFSTFILVPGMTFLLKVTSEKICHALQDQVIRRTSSCQMLIRVENIYPAKPPNAECSSENSETAVNKNERAAFPDLKEIKFQITTGTASKKRLNRRQIKGHRMKKE